MGSSKDDSFASAAKYFVWTQRDTFGEDEGRPIDNDAGVGTLSRVPYKFKTMRRVTLIDEGRETIDATKVMRLIGLVLLISRPLLFSGFKNSSLGWSERNHPRDLEMVTLMMNWRALLSRYERKTRTQVVMP